MSSVVDDLIRDTSSLQRFIASIYKHRDEPEKTHREPTIQFLKYIRALSDNAQNFLQRFLNQMAQSPFDPDIASKLQHSKITAKKTPRLFIP